MGGGRGRGAGAKPLEYMATCKTLVQIPLPGCQDFHLGPNMVRVIAWGQFWPPFLKPWKYVESCKTLILIPQGFRVSGSGVGVLGLG